MLLQFADGQSSYIHVSAQSTVDTANADIRSVIKVWEKYLNARPDSVYANPYWVESEQHRYSPFDLAGHLWWNMYYGIGHYKARVLSVSISDSAFILRTMFYGRDSSEFFVRNIFQVAARIENGSYKLCNVLPINSRYWHKEEVGSIKFVFPPDHEFNRPLAEHMYKFIDSLAALWHLEIKPTQYYFADDLDRVCKVLGMDYWPAEGNIRAPRGFVDSHNRIIYSGGSNEWFPHEFVHIYINPLFPGASPYFLEGYATLLGGTGGHDLLWHIRRNYGYLKDHPQVDVLQFKGVDMYVDQNYFIGGLVCKMAEEKGGLPLIRKLMTYGREDADFYKAILDVFGVDKKDLGTFLRQKLSEYASR